VVNFPDYWYVVYTKSNAELKVADRLLSIGINSFAPTRTEFRQWSDRVKKIEVPLLTSMVLVQLQSSEFKDVFEVNGVLRYLFVNGVRAIVKQEEVDAMMYYVDQKHKVQEEALKEGDVIVVPHMKVEGELLRIKGKKCLVKLEKLGYTVSFQLK
jgi:transcriptional antiterminator RfaH